MGIGKPVYGSGNIRKTFTIKDGNNIYRILPPFGPLAEDGQWSRYWRVHWGYGVLSDDKTKVVQRPFKCVEQVKWQGKQMTIVEECPACIKRKSLEDNYANTKRSQEGKTSSEALKDLLAPLTVALKRFNTDGKYYMNVMNQAGEIGKLGIPGKMNNALKIALKEFIEKYKFDPIDVEGGTWFNFKRTPGSKISEYLHAVEPVMGVRNITDNETNTVVELPVAQRVPLTEDIVKRMETEAYDLTDLFQIITQKDVKTLVDGDADPEICASVFNRQRTETNHSNGMKRAEPQVQEAPVVPRPTPTPKVESVEVKAPVCADLGEPEVDPDEAVLMAKLAEIKAKKAAKVAQEVQVKAAPAPKSSAVPAIEPTEEMDSMSDEDFAKLAYSG